MKDNNDNHNNYSKESSLIDDNGIEINITKQEYMALKPILEKLFAPIFKGSITELENKIEKLEKELYALKGQVDSIISGKSNSYREGIDKFKSINKQLLRINDQTRGEKTELINLLAMYLYNRSSDINNIEIYKKDLGKDTRQWVESFINEVDNFYNINVPAINDYLLRHDGTDFNNCLLKIDPQKKKFDRNVHKKTYYHCAELKDGDDFNCFVSLGYKFPGYPEEEKIIVFKPEPGK